MSDKPTMWWGDAVPDTVPDDVAVQIELSQAVADAERARLDALDQLARLVAPYLTVQDLVPIMRLMPHDVAVQAAGMADAAGLPKRARP